jgi:hypothetical protein
VRIPGAFGRVVVVVTLWEAAVARGNSDLSDRKKKIEAKDRAPAPEAVNRKKRSETVLRAEAVPINRTLPVVETEAEAKRRSKNEVAYRALALLVVAVKGEGLDQKRTLEVVKEYGLAPYFTPKEKAFIDDASPPQQDRVQFSWRYEAAWTLLWALGYVDKLDKPVALCDVPRAVKTMKQRTAAKFIAEAKLRPLSEILDQADLVYRYHWAVVDARLKGKQLAGGIEPGVIMERHYTLNWLIGYMDQAWDDVTTDT